MLLYGCIKIPKGMINLKKHLLAVLFLTFLIFLIVFSASGCSFFADVGGTEDSLQGTAGTNTGSSSSNDTYQSVGKPDDSGNKTTESEPQATESEPQATESEPQATESEPQTTESEPQTTESEPQATESEPQTTESEPQATESEPQTTEPGLTAAPEYFPGAPTICIDPGHGFTDPGAIASLNQSQIYESTLNLQISLALSKALNSLGYNVVLTHNGTDEPDEEYLDDTLPRFNVNMRNKWIRDRADEIDLVISVHCNSYSSSSVSGSRYYILPSGASGYNSDSYTLMADIISSVKSAFSLSKEPTWYRQSLAVLATGLPSVLLECGFMTNPGDLANLQDPAWQQKYASAVAAGIAEYCAENIEGGDSLPSVPADAPTICIDPGHGFTDPGAIASLNQSQIYESTLNLQISLALSKALNSLGYNVVLTHNGTDEPDEEYLDDTLPRFNVNMRNKWIRDRADEIDLVISVHCNSYSSSSVSGSRYYILPSGASGYNSDSYTLMADIISSVKSAFSLSKEPTWYRQSLAVLATGLPSVLLECGFMTNPGDLANLQDPAWQQKYASAVAAGIAEYLGK